MKRETCLWINCEHYFVSECKKRSTADRKSPLPCWLRISKCRSVIGFCVASSVLLPLLSILYPTWTVWRLWHFQCMLEYFSVSHLLPNSDMKHRIFNKRMWSFCMCIRMGDLSVWSHLKDYIFLPGKDIQRYLCLSRSLLFKKKFRGCKFAVTCAVKQKKSFYLCEHLSGASSWDGP